VEPAAAMFAWRHRCLPGAATPSSRTADCQHAPSTCRLCGRSLQPLPPAAVGRLGRSGIRAGLRTKDLQAGAGDVSQTARVLRGVYGASSERSWVSRATTAMSTGAEARRRAASASSGSRCSSTAARRMRRPDIVGKWALGEHDQPLRAHRPASGAPATTRAARLEASARRCSTGLGPRPARRRATAGATAHARGQDGGRAYREEATRRRWAWWSVGPLSVSAR
jgi:hypothetical protein